MAIRILSIVITSLFLMACASTNKKAFSVPADRAVAGILFCKDLFKSKLEIRVLENNLPKNDKNAVLDATIGIMSEVVPKSIDDTFWRVVEEISRNENTTFKVDTDKMVLIKQVNENLKLHTTYMYDPASNLFMLKKIEYTEKNRATQELTSEPLYKESHQLREDLSLKLSDISIDAASQMIAVPASITLAMHKKITAELKNLNLFTTHELLKISQLPANIRLAKYQFLLAGRKVRNFLIRDFMEELIKKPIKTIVISMISVAILSHTDFIKNIVSIKNTTPDWVAPSIVKMAGRYPENTQVEIVQLMKTINLNNKKNIKIFENQLKSRKELVNIDDVDQFTIQADTINKKTYFVMNHENQNGSMDIYSVEIDPTQYPRLAARAQEPN